MRAASVLPTPGTAVSCSAVALLRLIFAAGAGLADAVRACAFLAGAVWAGSVPATAGVASTSPDTPSAARVATKRLIFFISCLLAMGRARARRNSTTVVRRAAGRRRHIASRTVSRDEPPRSPVKPGARARSPKRARAPVRRTRGTTGAIPLPVSLQPGSMLKTLDLATRSTCVRAATASTGVVGAPRPRTWGRRPLNEFGGDKEG